MLEKSYWNSNGKLQFAIDELQKLVPAEGEVPNKRKNPALIEEEILAMEGEIEDGENVEMNRTAISEYQNLLFRVEQEINRE